MLVSTSVWLMKCNFNNQINRLQISILTLIIIHYFYDLLIVSIKWLHNLNKI